MRLTEIISKKQDYCEFEVIGAKYQDVLCLIESSHLLKDIEDELGIDLITLFKALKNGVYII